MGVIVDDEQDTAALRLLLATIRQLREVQQLLTEKSELARVEETAAMLERKLPDGAKSLL